MRSGNVEEKQLNFRQCLTLNYSLQPRGGVSDKVLKSYCWMYSSFNIPPSFEGNCARTTQEITPIYNSYYQWVPIFLIFQAFVFYVPRMIWLMLEGG